jgi:hypothetical protein
MREQYDLTKLKGGVRGKYAGRLPTEIHVVALDPDVAKAFPDAKSVNDALRSILEVAQRIRKKRKPPSRK